MTDKYWTLIIPGLYAIWRQAMLGYTFEPDQFAANVMVGIFTDNDYSTWADE
jgi:hypothetical protein